MVLAEFSFRKHRAIHILHFRPDKTFSLSVVSNTLRGELFRETVRVKTGQGNGFFTGSRCGFP
jgi:hypothetical protein